MLWVLIRSVSARRDASNGDPQYMFSRRSKNNACISDFNSYLELVPYIIYFLKTCVIGEQRGAYSVAHACV